MTEAVVDLAEWLRSMHPTLKRGVYAFASLSAASGPSRSPHNAAGLRPAHTASRQSWTVAAQEAGFADSAHLRRTWRRMIGPAPASLARETAMASSAG